jgi:DNA-binding beta-propeller fold protein YncE
MTPNGPERPFAGDLLVLVDADMPAYAYANGILEPRTGADGVVRLRLTGGQARSEALAPAPNSVTSWPGAMAVSSDGRLAYVVAYRGSPAPDVTQADDLNAALGIGASVRVLRLADVGLESLGDVTTAGGPNGVAVAHDGRTLVVSTETKGSELQFFQLIEGIPQAPVTIPIDLAGGVGMDAGRITNVAWSPNAEVVAAVLGGNEVGLVRVVRSADGAVMSATLSARIPIEADLLSMVRWSPDGRFVYALDTGWGAGRLDRIVNGPGRIHVITMEGEAARLTQSIETGLSSESFAISADGSLIASLNMHRTYLPPGFPTGLLPGRESVSVTLFAIDPATGRLTRAGQPARIPGVLPQGIAFDRNSENLAVTVFQEPDPASVAGWIAFLRIDGEGQEARLVPTPARVPMPRGGHYLLLSPAAGIEASEVAGPLSPAP